MIETTQAVIIPWYQTIRKFEELTQWINAEYKQNNIKSSQIIFQIVIDEIDCLQREQDYAKFIYLDDNENEITENPYSVLNKKTLNSQGIIIHEIYLENLIKWLILKKEIKVKPKQIIIMKT